MGHTISLVILVVVCGIVLWRRLGLRIPLVVLIIPLLAGIATLAMWAELDIAMRVIVGFGLSGALATFVVRSQLISREDLVGLWHAGESRSAET